MTADIQQTESRKSLLTRLREAKTTTKVALGVTAALALTGVGGAYAAWQSTHDVTASVVTTDPSYSLSTNGTTFVAGDVDVTSLIDQLKPGSAINVPIWAKNTTSGKQLADETVVKADIVALGAIFDSSLGAPATVKWDATPVGKALPKAGTAVKIGTLQITTPSNWPDAYRAKAGTLSINVQVE